MLPFELKTHRLTAVAVVAGIVGIDWGKPPRETQTRNLKKYIILKNTKGTYFRLYSP